MSAEHATWFRQTFESIRSEVQKVIVGQEEVVNLTLMGLASNGHVLLEGMPGLGKTLLVRSLAEALSLDFSRVQFTPDMMPADVTGTNVLTEHRTFEFRKGPIFANIVLADEINRATPKTQSALLEAMQERSVTVGGKKHILTEPFLVMATQNPVEQEGTYPLPEAQLDRFFVKVLVPYPTKKDLAEVIARTTGTASDSVKPVASQADVLRMRDIAKEVVIAPNVLEFGLSMVVGTHPDSPEASPLVKRYVRYGSSPRGAQSMVMAAKVRALLSERFNVSREDLIEVAKPVLRHRILLNFEAEADAITADRILDDLIQHVQAGDRDPVRV